MDCNIGDKIEFTSNHGLKIMTIDRIASSKKDKYTPKRINYFGIINNKGWVVPYQAIIRVL